MDDCCLLWMVSLSTPPNPCMFPPWNPRRGVRGQLSTVVPRFLTYSFQMKNPPCLAGVILWRWENVSCFPYLRYIRIMPQKRTVFMNATLHCLLSPHQKPLCFAWLSLQSMLARYARASMFVYPRDRKTPNRSHPFARCSFLPSTPLSRNDNCRSQPRWKPRPRGHCASGVVLVLVTVPSV